MYRETRNAREKLAKDYTSLLPVPYLTHAIPYCDTPHTTVYANEDTRGLQSLYSSVKLYVTSTRMW